MRSLGASCVGKALVPPPQTISSALQGCQLSFMLAPLQAIIRSAWRCQTRHAMFAACKGLSFKAPCRPYIATQGLGLHEPPSTC